MGRQQAVVAVAIVLVLAGCLGVLGIDDGHQPDDAGPQVDIDDGLEIHHIDVGQADSTLVITPTGETILIDSGNWRTDGTRVVDYLEAHDIDRIDHLVATHAHADHIGGHAAVIERLETHGDGIGAAYDSGLAHTTQTYDSYLDAIEEYSVQLFEVQTGDELPLEDDTVSASVLNPPAEKESTDLNENNIVLRIEYGEFTYLLTGDAEEDAEMRMLAEEGQALESDLYKAGHHGSSTSSNEPFVAAVDPDIAVISSPVDSEHGHPHDEVLERFDRYAIETYWTGVHGNVTVETDGDSIVVTPERQAPTDPAALLEEKHGDQQLLPFMVYQPAAETAEYRLSIDTAGALAYG